MDHDISDEHALLVHTECERLLILDEKEKSCIFQDGVYIFSSGHQNNDEACYLLTYYIWEYFEYTTCIIIISAQLCKIEVVVANVVK